MTKAELVHLWEEATKNPQKRAFFHREFGEYLKTLSDEPQNAPEQAKGGGTRSSLQNAAIHLWLSQVASELDRHGHTLQNIVSQIKKAEIRPNKDNLKETLWKPYQIVAVGKKSTTQLNKSEVDVIYEGLNKFLGENFEIHIPFPSNETKFWQDQAEAMEYKTGHTPQNYEYPTNDLGETVI